MRAVIIRLHARAVAFNPQLPPLVRGSVQQGLSAAGGALGFYTFGRAADRRYSLCIAKFRCVLLGRSELQNPSIQSLTSRAESGDVEAQTLLGTIFHEGDGVERSPPDAIYWWQRAAFNGHAGAQAMLGVAYHVGIVFEKDVVQAAQWIMRSARQGNELAVTIGAACPQN